MNGAAVGVTSRGMTTFLLILQALIGAALVGVILMQQSEGGGLGMGGSPSGLMSARGAADFLTRATAVLASIFVALSIVQAVLATRTNAPVIDTSLARPASGAPTGATPPPAPTLPADPLASPGVVPPSPPASPSATVPSASVRPAPTPAASVPPRATVTRERATSEQPRRERTPAVSNERPAPARGTAPLSAPAATSPATTPATGASDGGNAN